MKKRHKYFGIAAIVFLFCAASCKVQERTQVKSIEEVTVNCVMPKVSSIQCSGGGKYKLIGLDGQDFKSSEDIQILHFYNPAINYLSVIDAKTKRFDRGVYLDGDKFQMFSRTGQTVQFIGVNGESRKANVIYLDGYINGTKYTWRVISDGVKPNLK